MRMIRWLSGTAGVGMVGGEGGFLVAGEGKQGKGDKDGPKA